VRLSPLGAPATSGPTVPALMMDDSRVVREMSISRSLYTRRKPASLPLLSTTNPT
jgi:hypothetical protein